MFVRADLQRTGVDHLLTRRVTEPAVSERDDADRDEDETNDAERFHRLERPPTLDQIDDQDHDRDHEQDMNESAQRVRGDESE